MKLTIDGYSNIIYNKYYFIYRNLIIKRKLNPANIDDYYEIHHILPKSMGGDNSQENLVALTAREHFITHLLLTKFVIGKDKYKILCAFNAMNMKSDNTKNRYNSQSKIYSFFNEELSKEKSKFMKELWNDENYKNTMIEKAKESWINGSRIKQLEYMKLNSPFLKKEIHDKTMETREKNKSNIFIISNPMFNHESKKKKIEKTSGINHYLVKNKIYYYKFIDGGNWVKLPQDTVSNICKKMGWKVSSFNAVLYDKRKNITKGELAGIVLKVEYNENIKN